MLTYGTKQLQGGRHAWLSHCVECCWQRGKFPRSSANDVFRAWLHCAHGLVDRYDMTFEEACTTIYPLATRINSKKSITLAHTFNNQLHLLFPYSKGYNYYLVVTKKLAHYGDLPVTVLKPGMTYEGNPISTWAKTYVQDNGKFEGKGSQAKNRVLEELMKSY